MMRSRLLVVTTMMTLVAILLAPTANAAEEGGKAAGAARFVGFAEPPLEQSALSKALGLLETDSLVADAVVSSVAIYEAAESTTPVRSMDNPTREGVLLLFGVIEEKGEWLKVMLPMRPNGSTGWVKAADVEVRKVSHRIEVHRTDRVLRLFQGDQVLFEAPAAVGTSRTPTPLTRAYVDIAVPFKPTSGAYGAYMLSVAAYSEVLTNFGGGVGQLAIHGTNNLGSIGKESSNGCIRLSNEDILRLKDLAPTGTPVDIVA